MKTKPFPEFGRRVSELRRFKYFTQEQLARETGCGIGSVMRWEQGRGVPRFASLHRLAAALSVPVEDLVRGTEMDVGTEHEVVP